ncbi:hypothetical protein ACFE04_003666 [Oxalis oulophora]
MEVVSKYVTIKDHVNGAAQESDFEFKSVTLSLSDSNDIIVKNLYVSVDPYQLNRMKSTSSSQTAIDFAVGIVPGKEIDTYGVGKVMASRNSEFQEGDLVIGLFTWGEYTLVELLKDKLGFDDAFNYKDEDDLKSALKRYFPDGIDIYFDNVGGGMLEAAIANMNTFGRVAVCGVISEYADNKNRAAPSMLDIIYKRITVQGFLAADYLTKYSDFITMVSDHLRTGALRPLDDISEGIESIPSAFIGLFCGSNVGKKMVKIADE